MTVQRIRDVGMDHQARNATLIVHNTALEGLDHGHENCHHGQNGPF
jgi:hypothetical protein